MVPQPEVADLRADGAAPGPRPPAPALPGGLLANGDAPARI